MYKYFCQGFPLYCSKSLEWQFPLSFFSMYHAKLPLCPHCWTFSFSYAFRDHVGFVDDKVWRPCLRTLLAIRKLQKLKVIQN